MLLQLINEEYSRVNRKPKKKLQEGLRGVDDSLRQAEIVSLIKFAKAYSILNGNAQAALDDLVGGTFNSINPESVEAIEQYLGGCNKELDHALKSFIMSSNDDTDPSNY